MMLIGRLHVCGFQAGLWFAMFWTVWRTVASRFVDWWEPAVKNIAANMITLNSYLVSSVDMLDYVTVAFWFRVRVCGKFSTFPARGVIWLQDIFFKVQYVFQKLLEDSCIEDAANGQWIFGNNTEWEESLRIKRSILVRQPFHSCMFLVRLGLVLYCSTKSLLSPLLIKSFLKSPS